LLPPATEQAWDYLKKQSSLDGFVLVGGSALALTIRHRLSEDLDFIFLGTRLPGRRLEALCRQSQSENFDFQRNDDEAAIEEFALGGAELHEAQQDFLVNGAVKVSFFVADEAQRKIFSKQSGAGVRIASLAELFKSKALVSSVRSKTRDWFDLYLLMREHGFTIRDYRSAFAEAGNPASCDIGLARLCSGIPQRNDEGFSHLISAPPTLNEIKSFFVEQRNQLEIETAAEAARSEPEEKN